MKGAQYDLSRFTCTRCGNCCRQPGYVRLQAGEAEKIAELLNMSHEAFTAEYTRLTHDRRGLSLNEQTDGSCVFLTDANLCRIQSAKPLQCSGFPFTWSYPDTETICPGFAACKIEDADRNTQ